MRNNTNKWQTRTRNTTTISPHLHMFPLLVKKCVRARACSRPCVRALVRAVVRACVCVCVCARMRVCMRAHPHTNRNASQTMLQTPTQSHVCGCGRHSQLIANHAANTNEINRTLNCHAIRVGICICLRKPKLTASLIAPPF